MFKFFLDALLGKLKTFFFLSAWHTPRREKVVISKVVPKFPQTVSENVLKMKVVDNSLRRSWIPKNRFTTKNQEVLSDIHSQW